MPRSLTLVTPTHDRPDAFSLCERWMSRQTYDLPLQWIVVDDGVTPVQTTMNQQVVRLDPVNIPRESFRKNYLEALQHVKGDTVVFIEDDDWYSVDYLEHIDGLLTTGRTLVGQRWPRYYNVRYLKYLIHKNSTHHSSLCQTAMDVKWIPTVTEFLRSSPAPERLDTFLWKRLGVPQSAKRLEPRSTKCVGMKGLSKSFVGIHHTERSIRYYQPDTNGDVLRSWIGDDAETYLKLNLSD